MIVQQLFATLGIQFSKQQFDAANKQLNGVATNVGRLVGAVTAIGAVKLGFNIARESAQFEDARRIFEASGASLEKFRKVSHGLLSDKLLVEKFNFSAQFGMKEDEFLGFIEVADAAAKKLGKSQDYIFTSIMNGIARRENRWLDNAGIIVDKDRLNRAYAKEHGIKVKDMTAIQQREVLIQEALREQGLDIINDVKLAGAGAGDGASDFYDAWDASISNVKLAFGMVLDAGFKEAFLDGLKWVAKNQKKLVSWAKTLTTVVVPAVKLLGLTITAFALRGIGLMVLGARTLVLQFMRWASWAGLVALSTLSQAAANLVLAASTGGVAAGFATATAAVWGFFVSLMGLPIMVGLMVAVIVILIDELISMFTDTHGVFEQMAGKWGDVVARMWDNAMDPNLWWPVRAIALLAAGITGAISLIDKFYATLFSGVEAVMNGGLGDIAATVLPYLMGGEENMRNTMDFVGSAASAVGSSFGQANIRAPGTASWNRAPAQTERLQVDINANGASAADQSLAENIGQSIETKINKSANKRAMSRLTPSSGKAQ